MTNDRISKRAKAVVLGLRGYSQRDAISILAEAISILAAQQAEQAGERFDGAYLAFNDNLRRRRGGISRIEQNPEIKAFIHSVDRYYTGPELLSMIEKRFGAERTPSKSSLGRYLQKIASITSQDQEVANDDSRTKNQRT